MRHLQALELRTETCPVQGGGVTWRLSRARSDNKLVLGSATLWRAARREPAGDSPLPAGSRRSPAFEQQLAREGTRWSIFLPVDAEELLGLGAKCSELFAVFRTEVSLHRGPAGRPVVIVAGPRRLAQSVVAH